MTIPKIGKYDIVRELGRGTMGIVYLGRDPAIQRQVAIKTVRDLPLDASDDQRVLVERFRREAQTAGNLSHPNIVTIYEFGQEGDVTYIAMEYLPGPTLESLIGNQLQLKLDVIVHIVGQICGALDYAHTYNIVHRDVKPGNVMLLDGYTIKVADFGIASVEDSSLTRTGSVVGTPFYMSPEQFTGHGLDGRSDLYSVGVILYELLTGEKPFAANQLSALMHRVLHSDPVPPCSINPTLPGEVDAIVLKALAKRPEERYQLGEDLREALRPYAGDPRDWADVHLGDTGAPVSAPTADRPPSTVTERTPVADSIAGTIVPEAMKAPAAEDMVAIPGGTYRIGTDSGPRAYGPEHDVEVQSFLIDTYPVTNYDYQQHQPQHEYPRERGDHPVTNISWFEAQAYAEALGKRLPTEAEWEVAARGHHQQRWPWGDAFEDLKCNANSQGTVDVDFYPLGQSSFGVHDLCGNAWEWCADSYEPYPGSAEAPEAVRSMYRAIRGGSWRTPPQQATCSARRKLMPGTRADDVGFRCARDAS